MPHIPEKLLSFPQEYTLKPGQQTPFDEVLQHFQDEDYVLPNVEDGALTDEERFWLSYECIHRYLRAVKWASSKAAIKRLEETLIWRREFGLYGLITHEHVEPEATTGKEVLFGYDVDGRPALYLRPSRQNTGESIRQLHFLTWTLERCVDLMGPGVENIALMVDVSDRAKMPSIAQSRATVNILQNHYPERLGRALITNVPFLVNAFFRIITPLLDPVTREKMRFNPACIKDGLFTPEMLMKEWGGAREFEYDHEQYWSALVKMCDERRMRMMDAWRSQGSTVGIKEWEVKCAIDDHEQGTGVMEQEKTQAITESVGEEIIVS